MESVLAFDFNHIYDHVVERVITSWDKSQADLAAREAAGTQPQSVMRWTSLNEIVVANVIYMTVIIALYVWMSQRSGDFKTQLKPIIVVYNAICVFLAGYVVYGVVEFKLNHWDDLQFVCNESARVGPIGERLAWVYWTFAAQKYWEFCDTWFFLLRKNFNQVSFLHVYHHASITFVVGYLLRYSFTGDVYLAIVLNAFVHVVMYSHYLVTALGFKSWWSQYLTSMQLIQFVLIAVQSAIAWFTGPECGLYDWQKFTLIVYMGTMLVLFGNFFVNKYLRKAPKKDAAKEKKAQ